MSARYAGSMQLSFARAELRGSGKSAVIDGVLLYTDGGEGGRVLLRGVVALMNDASDGAEIGAHAHRTLIVSAVGRRLDHPSLDASLRVRGGTLEQGRMLLAEIAQRWNARAAVDSPTSSDAPDSEASVGDAMRLHRYHLAARADGVRLDHPELRLTAKVKAADPQQAEAFAYRLALAWNMAEGWSQAAIEAGTTLALDDALLQLVEAHERSEDTTQLVAEVARQLRKRASLADRTHGRLHDCAQCLRRMAAEGAEGDEAANTEPT